MKGFLRRFPDWLRKRKFLTSVLTLLGGAVAGQGILVLASPFITRLYGPGEFGALAVFTALVTLLLSIASVKYEMAIPLPKDGASAANLVFMSIVVVIIFSAAVALLLIPVAGVFFGWIRAPQLRPYAWLLPIGLLGAGVVQALTYWASRRRQFGLLSWARGLQSGAQVVLQLGGGLLRLGIIGLVAGYALSQFAGLASLLRRSGLSPKTCTPSHWRELASKYRDFPRYSALSAIMTVLGAQLPVILFARCFTIDVTGFFSLAIRVLGLPVSLVGASVGQVFYPEAAAQKENAALSKSMFERTAGILFILAFAVFAFIGFNGPELFSLVFGAGWKTAGRYAQYLAPWLMLSFVASPLSSFSMVAGAQKQSLWFSSGMMVLRMVSIWLGARWQSAELAVLFFSISGSIICVFYFAWVLGLAGSGLGRWCRSMRSFLLTTVLVLGALGAMQRGLAAPVFIILSGVLLAAVSLWFLARAEKEVEDG